MSAGDNYLEWKRRATQAENELRALKLSHERLRKECMDAEARAERAEADNAALLEAYRRTWGCVMHDNVVHSPACNDREDGRGDCAPECPALRVSSLLKADHPGAALLEYVRALEEFYTATATDDIVRRRRAAAAIDALKERKP
jgi:chromosome segregation ATPase